MFLKKVFVVVSLSVSVLCSVGMINSDKSLESKSVLIEDELILLRKEMVIERKVSAFLQKQLILHQMFRNIDRALNTERVWDPRDIGYGRYCLAPNVYGSIILSMRYLGGTNDFLTSANGTFMTTDGRWEELWVNDVYGDLGTPHRDAVFADLIGNQTLANIRELGNGSIIDGYGVIRDWLSNSFPTIAYLFGNIATNHNGVHMEIYGTNHYGPWVDENGHITNVAPEDLDVANVEGDLNWKLPEQLRQLFVEGILTYEDNYGVPEREGFYQSLRNELKALYNPDVSFLRSHLE